eukprot:3144891-Pleurochrysis_carterae.AAC.1
MQRALLSARSRTHLCRISSQEILASLLSRRTPPTPQHTTSITPQTHQPADLRSLHAAAAAGARSACAERHRDRACSSPPQLPSAQLWPDHGSCDAATINGPGRHGGGGTHNKRAGRDGRDGADGGRDAAHACDAGDAGDGVNGDGGDWEDCGRSSVGLASSVCEHESEEEGVVQQALLLKLRRHKREVGALREALTASREAE